MKRYIAFFLLLLPFLAGAQDIDVKGLAQSAPESVVQLAKSLKPASEAANEKAEFAINALTQFASDPANAAVQPAVKEGFRKAIEETSDEYNKAFLQAQYRIVAYDEAAPVVQPQTAPDPALPIYKPKKFKRMSPENQCDALYRIGEARDASQLPLVLSALSSTDNLDVYRDAAVAASKIGGDAAAEALVAEFSREWPTGDFPSIVEHVGSTVDALLSFNGDISKAVAQALPGKTDDATFSLLHLVGERRISEAAPFVFQTLKSDNKQLRSCAEHALKGVVGPTDVNRVALLMDRAHGHVKEYEQAYLASLCEYSAADQFAIVKAQMAHACHPERFLGVAASTGTDDAAEMIVAKADEDLNPFTLKALCGIDNFKVADKLLAISEKHPEVLHRYIELVGKYEDNSLKYEDYHKALSLATAFGADDVIDAALYVMRYVPCRESFEEVATYMDNLNYAYTAAETVRAQVRSIAPYTPYSVISEVLGKAAEVYDRYKSGGDVDAGYALDDIHTILDELK